VKSNKIIIFLLILTIGFTFSFLLTDNLEFNAENSEKSSGYNYDMSFDNQNLKISQISEKIHINNNWSAAKAAGICTGDGTNSNAYVIENLIIDCGGSGSGIMIENSNVYFRIENCTLYNAGTLYSGIELYNVDNSQLIDNNCSSNGYGIYLESGNYNTLSGNTANNNDKGIHISGDDNIVSGNTANNNDIHGIVLYSSSNNNTVSGNTANYNYGFGIFIQSSANNIVSGNTANNNDYGIYVSGDDNIISVNIANYNNWHGIILSDTNDNTISGNNVNYNDGNGIWLGRSDNTILYFNNFVDNNKHLSSFESSNSWNSPGKIIYTYKGANYTNYLGNYWDNYTGNDANNDGIGDSPFIIGGDIDNYPLMEPIENYEIILMLEPSGVSGGGIPGYNLFFLLSTQSIVAILIIRKMKKSSK